MPPIAALIFLPPVLVICLWVAWSDMKFMKIPNKAVLTLGAVYVVLGAGLGVFGLMDWPSYGWGLVLGAGVLALGFVVTVAGLIGAGDAKFAAVMAPFFWGAPVNFALALFAACMLAAFATHRLVKYTPLRRPVADWASWTHPDFPMGLALTSTLLIHLSLRAWPLFAAVLA